MLCNERGRLLNEYNDARMDASAASRAISRVAGTTAIANYIALLRKLEAAETRKSKARLAYEQHLVKHGCSSVAQKGVTRSQHG